MRPAVQLAGWRGGRRPSWTLTCVAMVTADLADCVQKLSKEVSVGHTRRISEYASGARDYRFNVHINMTDANVSKYMYMNVDVVDMQNASFS